MDTPVPKLREVRLEKLAKSPSPKDLVKQLNCFQMSVLPSNFNQNGSQEERQQQEEEREVRELHFSSQLEKNHDQLQSQNEKVNSGDVGTSCSKVTSTFTFYTEGLT